MLSANDKEYMICSIANGETIANVSNKLNKTEKEIKNYLLDHIREEVTNKKGLVAYYANEFNIPPNDIIHHTKSQAV